MIIYHFTEWPYTIGPYGETMIIVMMFPRWCIDVLMVIAGIFGVTAGFLPHIVFLIAEIVFLAWPESWIEYLRFLGFPNAQNKLY